jgi:4-amino-4-deoxy-L-arabinose transferase-like glycosyltransferase
LRVISIALIGLALVLGASLRFFDLGAYEMSADEGASWAAAAQPSFAEVIESQRRLNPAELGLHDVTLHYWMYLFGDSLTAMRALSAVAGTIAIFLTYTATKELLTLDAISGSSADSDENRNLTAALAALMLAVNLITIKYSRELRMYPLMLALVLAQITCFTRTARRGTAVGYLGTCIFTAAAIAAHPMAILIFASEGGWLLYPLGQYRLNLSQPLVRKLLYLAGSVAAGVILAAIVAYPMLASGHHAAQGGLLNWVQRPALWEPFALFNKGIGSVAFPLFAALAIWGAIRGWHRARSVTLFALLWMLLPPLALMAASYALRPVFVERYLIAAFVPFFILAALGILELPGNLVRTAAATLAVILALGHVYAWSRRPHDTQWREGALVAVATASGSHPISVAPAYAINVVRYYLGDAAAAQTRAADSSAVANGDVLLLSDQSKGEAALKLTAQYSHVVAHLRGLEVRSAEANRN